jgi:hypothetical protein
VRSAQEAVRRRGEWKVNVCRGEPCVRPSRNEQEEKKGGGRREAGEGRRDEKKVRSAQEAVRSAQERRMEGECL